MNDRMKVGHLYPANTPVGVRNPAVSQHKTTVQGPTFQELLKSNALKFSHHAEVRMQQRGIVLKPEQLGQIANALDQAEAKGAKDSLLLLRDIAMIVNVPSRTVVTAIDGKSLAGNVFTQIDSAVLIQ